MISRHESYLGLAIAVLAVFAVPLTWGSGVLYPNKNPTPGDLLFDNYFALEVARIAEASMADIKTLEDWQRARVTYRQQLHEMLGLDPLPRKTDLKATVTGKVNHPDFTVEKLHYQSMPGLYVTANLYVPKRLTKPAPAILYVCGHGKVIIDGVSYGNKANYQHHGAWFARNGYVCLTIDTVQLGEIEGIHHGTCRKNMWWWNSRGYSSAATEAWNCIRALDYLQSRPEVDADRLGVTGRSGGGAYSWWIATLDERIKAAAPVAGITDLQNHVVDGVVESHCDCMYQVNTYRWDYDQIAAMVAPRALLICNTDDDRIFPLDGVHRVFQNTRRIYQLHQAKDKLGLVIIPGGHYDTQPLRVPVFDWFNKHLKGDQTPITMAAEKLFTPQELKVLKSTPANERTSHIYESFTQLAKTTGKPLRNAVMKQLREKVFRGWPKQSAAPDVKQVAETEKDGIVLTVLEFTTQDPFRLRAYIARPRGAKLKGLHLETINHDQWGRQLAIARAGFAPAFADEFRIAGTKTDAPLPPRLQQEFKRWAQYMKKRQSAYVTFTARGIGNTVPKNEERHRVHLQRRFMLIGQTLPGMRTYDILRAIEILRAQPEFKKLPLHIWADGRMANNAILASLFAGNIEQLHLSNVATDDREAPDHLNLSRVASWPDLIKLVGQKTKVHIAKPKGNK